MAALVLQRLLLTQLLWLCWLPADLQTALGAVLLLAVALHPGAGCLASHMKPVQWRLIQSLYSADSGICTLTSHH